MDRLLEQKMTGQQISSDLRLDLTVLLFRAVASNLGSSPTVRVGVKVWGRIARRFYETKKLREKRKTDRIVFFFFKYKILGKSSHFVFKPKY